MCTFDYYLKNIHTYYIHIYIHIHIHTYTCANNIFLKTTLFPHSNTATPSSHCVSVCVLFVCVSVWPQTYICSLSWPTRWASQTRPRAAAAAATGRVWTDGQEPICVFIWTPLYYQTSWIDCQTVVPSCVSWCLFGPCFCVLLLNSYSNSVKIKQPARCMRVA